MGGLFGFVLPHPLGALLRAGIFLGSVFLLGSDLGGRPTFF